MKMSAPSEHPAGEVMQPPAADPGYEQRDVTAVDFAQEVIHRAFDVSGPEQVRLAHKALDISPDCVDAYVLLAQNADSIDEALELHEQAVAAGQRLLGKGGLERYSGQFWGRPETRPYMRARQGLAECLWKTGRWAEAAEHYQEMLRLNPNDDQGVRHSLATLLLALDRDEDFHRLLTRFQEDTSAEYRPT